jgi:hypothetical protein
MHGLICPAITVASCNHIMALIYYALCAQKLKIMQIINQSQRFSHQYLINSFHKYSTTGLAILPIHILITVLYQVSIIFITHLNYIPQIQTSTSKIITQTN